MNAKREGLEILAKGVDDFADFVWSGAKKGKKIKVRGKPTVVNEISGTEVMKKSDQAERKAYKEIEEEYSDDFDADSYEAEMDLENAYTRHFAKTNYKFLNQLLQSSNKEFVDYVRKRVGLDPNINADNLHLQDIYDISNSAINGIAYQFSILEQAGIPREWTGKVFLAYQKNPYLSGIEYPYPKEIAKAMRGLTNEQRSTFINLLPNWSQSIEQLGSTAKKLYRKPTRPS